MVTDRDLLMRLEYLQREQPEEYERFELAVRQGHRTPSEWLHYLVMHPAARPLVCYELGLEEESRHAAVPAAPQPEEYRSAARLAWRAFALAILAGLVSAAALAVSVAAFLRH